MTFFVHIKIANPPIKTKRVSRKPIRVGKTKIRIKMEKKNSLKRKLTKDEINNILDFIKPNRFIPLEVTESVNSKLRKL